MATLIKGLLAYNLDWQFVLVGVSLAVTVELCGVGVAVVRGGRLPAAVDHRAHLRRRRRARLRGARPSRKAGGARSHADAELGPGNLFATGLVAGGAMAGVVVALADRHPERGARHEDGRAGGRLVHGLGAGGYQLLGLAFFAAMAGILWRVARRPQQA